MDEGYERKCHYTVAPVVPVWREQRGLQISLTQATVFLIRVQGILQMQPTTFSISVDRQKQSQRLWLIIYNGPGQSWQKFRQQEQHATALAPE